MQVLVSVAVPFKASQLTSLELCDKMCFKTAFLKVTDSPCSSILSEIPLCEDLKLHVKEMLPKSVIAPLL